MQILKGVGKSYTISYLLKYADCTFFEYTSCPIFNEGYFIDSNEYSLHDLMDCIREDYEAVYEDGHLEYLIIYTNEKEEDLKQYIDYIKKNESLYDFTEILITCRE